MLIHLDTDIGGDVDDACALAMLLGRADVELIELTTNLDEGGRRAGIAAHHLALAGRASIPTVAGAGRLMTTHRHAPYTGPPYWDAQQRWSPSARSRTSPCWRSHDPARWPPAASS